MKRTFLAATLLLTLVVMILTAGCDKERIVENTEYVHDVEYVTLPPDTVIHFDTTVVNDSVTHHDTVTLLDTVIQVHTDTTVVTNTVIVHDTVRTIQTHYDTVTLVDTVITLQCSPNEKFAFASMEGYVNSLVIDFINTQFGYTDGWVFYLTQQQCDITRQSANVYDLYGYIDYWTPDWSGYYPLEFGYRMTFTGGDPADPNNWDLTDAPTTGSSKHPGGIRLVPNPSTTQREKN